MGSGERRPYLCPLLIDALRLLPVHPLTERDELGQARYQALRQGSGEVHGTAVSLEDLQELFVQGDDGHPRISREGACVLLELYQEGVLEIARHKAVEGGVELLQAYAQGRASIIGPGYWPKPRRTRARKVMALPSIERPTIRAVRGTPNQRTYQVTMHRLI